MSSPLKREGAQAKPDGGEATREKVRNLLLRLQQGPPLTLAEWVMAEDVLATSGYDRPVLRAGRFSPWSGQRLEHEA